MESAGMNVIRSNATRKRAIIGIAFFGDTHNRYFRQRACNKQVDSDRRCDKSDCEVNNHNDAELNRIDSDGFHNWKQDRCENQNGRRGIHDHADQQKECIDYKQNCHRTVEIFQNERAHGLRYLHQRQHT